MNCQTTGSAGLLDYRPQAREAGQTFKLGRCNPMGTIEVRGSQSDSVHMPTLPRSIFHNYGVEEN